jgi:hypothetical protein
MVTLKRIGGPPGWTVVLPSAVMLTSMLLTGESGLGLGACGACEVAQGRLVADGAWEDTACEVVAGPGLVVVPELSGALVLEQPATAAMVAAATIAATAIRLLMSMFGSFSKVWSISGGRMLPLMSQGILN